MKLWSLPKLMSSKSISLLNFVYAIPWKYCYIFQLQSISMLVTRHVFLLYYFPGFRISNTWSWAAFYRNTLIRMPWAETSWKSSAKPLGGLLSTLTKVKAGDKKRLTTLYEHRREAHRSIAPKVRSTAFLDHFLQSRKTVRMWSGSIMK